MSRSKINRGAVVRLWHHPRGHDYVVVGQNIRTRSLYLLKLNTINMDGSVHSAVKRFHKTVPYSSITRRNIVSNITKVMGVKDLDYQKIESFIRRHNEETQDNVTLLPLRRDFVCSPRSNNTISISYD